MRIQAIKDSSLSNTKKISFIVGITTFLISFVFIYRKLRGKFFKSKGKEKYKYSITQSHHLKTTNYNQYMELMEEAHDRYQSKANIWI